jgi:hypothetical protein
MLPTQPIMFPSDNGSPATNESALIMRILNGRGLETGRGLTAELVQQLQQQQRRQEQQQEQQLLAAILTTATTTAGAGNMGRNDADSHPTESFLHALSEFSSEHARILNSLGRGGNTEGVGGGGAGGRGVMSATSMPTVYNRAGSLGPSDHYPTTSALLAPSTSSVAGSMPSNYT